jgi:PAS domain S-box-containing protein
LKNPSQNISKGGLSIKNLTNLLNGVNIGILIVDQHGSVCYENNEGKTFLSNFINEKKASLSDSIFTLIENTLSKEIAIKKLPGYTICTILLEKTTENTFYGIIIFNTDSIPSIFTEKCSEEWKAILDSTQDAIFVDSGEGDTIWINKACEELYEISRADIIGKNIEYLEKIGVFSPSVAKMVLKKKQQVTILHSNKFGKQILTTGTPIFNTLGNIHQIISTSRDVSELIHLRNELEDIQNELEELKELQNDRMDNFVVKSKAMKDILQMAKRLAQIDSTVLITGESGVGKGEIAKYIHKLGDRKNKPFVKVNCGAIPDSLIESELFGYEYGAFTGSKKQGKLGLFELAQQGTIFLDEIGELPLNLQVKLLHVIQEKKIQKVGGLTTIDVDVRIITATNKDLREMVNEKLFREDLFYRLNVVPVHIPSLRERPEDIFPLIHFFIKKYNEKFNIEKRIDPNTMAALVKYPWPGNVRELENIIERLAITVRDDTILPQNLPNYILHGEDNTADITIPLRTGLKDAVEEVEKRIILNAITKYKTTRSAAKALGVSQPTIVRKMSRYKIIDSFLNHNDS